MSQVDKVEPHDEAQIVQEKPVEDNDIIRLSPEGQKQLVKDILNPPEPTPALLRAKESYARIIKKAC